MKKVLLITGARTPRSVELADGFADKIRHLVSDDVIIENCEISELFFELDAESVAIYHPKKEYDIRISRPLLLLKTCSVFRIR